MIKNGGARSRRRNGLTVHELWNTAPSLAEDIKIIFILDERSLVISTSTGIRAEWIKS